MTPDVSVIVPVYKVEKYLHRCIDSLVNQTYGNIEIILVDDGSPDGCAGMCDERALSDTRITVVHQQNCGLSSARNTGSDIAAGEYVIFLDSDDWSEPQLVETLFERVRISTCDAGVCGYYTDYKSLNVTRKLLVCDREEHISESNISDAIFKLLTDGGFDVVWNKIYRRAFLAENGLRFITDAMPMEDFLFNCGVFSKLRGFALVPGAWHHYIRQDGGTLVSKYDPRLYEKTKEKCARLKDLFLKREMWDERYKAGFARCYISAMFACVPNLYRGTEVPFSEKLSVFRAMCDDAELIDSLRWFSPTGTFMKLYCRLIKLRAPSFMACVFGVLFFFRNHCRKLYKSIFSFLLKRGKQ